MTHVIPDGTLIESDRAAGVRDNGNDWWFSRKYNAARQAAVSQDLADDVEPTTEIYSAAATFKTWSGMES
ncbi:hypothetical protein [Embleya sp. NBC_00896]|uniref:hypothetical protein n=1 Tax=Embleya sp. NBC_00896 TaxID=2975961 RepID=UPI003865CDBB